MDQNRRWRALVAVMEDPPIGKVEAQSNRYGSQQTGNGGADQYIEFAARLKRVTPGKE